MSLQKFLFVGFGGFFGSMSRYGLSRIVHEAAMLKVFPLGTFLINIIGSLLLGMVYAVSAKKIENQEFINLFLGVGFCGGFTTFSAFTWENLMLIQQRNFLEAILYSAGSFVIGIGAVWGGFLLMKGLL